MELLVPTLGESITEATVSKWLKKVGDSFEADEPLVEIETDKITVEVPAPSAGSISEIKVEEGADVNIGGVLALLDDKKSSNGSASAKKLQTKERPKSAYIGGKKDRFASSKTAVPGPGSYKDWNASTKVQDPKYSVSKSERKSKFDLSKSNGPDQGTYVHATTFEKNKNKMNK